MPYNGVGSVSDQNWVKKTRGLLEFLAEPRTWKDLKKCGAGNMTVLRQMLAWLEGEGEAKCFFRDEQCFWVRVGWVPQDEGLEGLIEEPNPLNPIIPKAPRLPTIPCPEAPNDPLDEPRPTEPGSHAVPQ